MQKENLSLSNVDNTQFKEKMKHAWFNLKHLSRVFLVLFIGYTVILGLTVLIN